MTDKNKEFILTFLSRMKEMGKYLRVVNDSLTYYKLPFQRLIGQNEYFEAFIQILRDNYIEGVEIFMKANIEVVTQLSAELKEFIAAPKNRYPTIVVNTKMNSLLLSTVKFLVQHQFKSSLAILIYLVENEDSLAILNGLYEILQKSPFQKHRELLEKMHARLSKLPHVPEASELKFLIDLFDEYYDHFCLADLEEWALVLDFYKAEDHDYAEMAYRELVGWFEIDPSHTFIIGKNHIIGLHIDGVEIPASITLLKKLKILVIENIKLKEFPKELAQLTNLRYLYIIAPNLKDVPNLAAMFPKLRCLGLERMPLKNPLEWLFEFARVRHSRRYIQKGVKKKDAAVLGLLEILIGQPLANDQPETRIARDYSEGRSIMRNLPFWEPQEKKLYNLAMKVQSDMAAWLRNTPDELPEEMLRMPWDYNEYDSIGLRYTLNESGNVIGLDIAIMRCERGEHLLPYFPEEICKLRHLQVLRLGFQYPKLYSEELQHDYSDYFLLDCNDDLVEARIPESIQELKELRYFWTNAKYSESLKPFLNSLIEFGKK